MTKGKFRQNFISRTILTVLFLIIMTTVTNFYKTTLQTQIESELGVLQLNDSIVDYTIGQQAAQGKTLIIFDIILVLGIILIWSGFLFKIIKIGNNEMSKNKLFSFLLLCFICCLLLTGCIKPPLLEKTEKIEPYETAFLIPLEGRSKAGQGKFMSVDFLEEAKVATKRVSIKQRAIKIGRFSFQIKWIPAEELIKVNRTPITREWTREKEKGTSGNDDAIYVESKDSIGFSVGLNLTALVKEEDTATFLYYHPGKSLAKDVDENVRGFATSILSREFSIRDLDRCKSEKGIIQGVLVDETVVFFKNLGITITNIGLVGGLNYTDPEIQKSINDAYVAEMRIKEEEKAKEAQVHTNAKLVSIAIAERKAAQEFEKAEKAMVKKLNLEILKIKAEAYQTAANKWNGATPDKILPQGSNFLFGLDQ